MASYVNKLANAVTNKTSSLVGRENLAKLTNSINRSLFSSKYRDYLLSGNCVQLISKSSHMTLQICASPNDPNRLILMGNGQVGAQFTNAHFIIEIEPKRRHIKFKNANNYLAFDSNVPCIFSGPLNPKSKEDQMRTRNEFRLHEIIGSDEYFALESCFCPGKYLAVLPDGSITITRNKTDENSQFFLNVINVIPANQRPGNNPRQSTISATPPQEQYAPMVVPAGAEANPPSPADEKEAESRLQENSSNNGAAQTSATASAQPETPPTYTSLFPQLPKS
jgi:hypothetical protein